MRLIHCWLERSPVMRAVSQLCGTRQQCHAALRCVFGFWNLFRCQERPGKTCFRFWQEGPGYDRNLTTPSVIEAAIGYIYMNPVQRGLVKRAVDWRWSSASWYLLDPPRQQ